MKKSNSARSWRKAGAIRLLCAGLVATCLLSACAQKNKFSDLLLSADEIATVESLYGQDMTETRAGLSLQESDLVESQVMGAWERAQPLTADGCEVSQILLFNMADETFYGTRFLCYMEDAQTLTTRAQELLAEAKTQYGEATTYPSLPNRLDSEEFIEAFAKAFENGEPANWREEWQVGEQTLCTLTAEVAGPGIASLMWEYSMSVAMGLPSAG